MRKREVVCGSAIEQRFRFRLGEKCSYRCKAALVRKSAAGRAELSVVTRDGFYEAAKPVMRLPWVARNTLEDVKDGRV